MLEADIPVVAEIELLTSPHPWRGSQFQESLVSHHCYVLDLQKQVVGFMIFTLVAGEAEILAIAVHPEHQGKGFGRSLLDYLIAAAAKSADKLFLEVRVSNFRARRLYTEAGFIELCLRENYYRTADGNEDAILMVLSLETG